MTYRRRPHTPITKRAMLDRDPVEQGSVSQGRHPTTIGRKRHHKRPGDRHLQAQHSISPPGPHQSPESASVTSHREPPPRRSCPEAESRSDRGDRADSRQREGPFQPHCHTGMQQPSSTRGRTAPAPVMICPRCRQGPVPGSSVATRQTPTGSCPGIRKRPSRANS